MKDINTKTSEFTKLDIDDLDSVAGGGLSDEAMARVKGLIEAARERGLTNRLEDVIATWEESDRINSKIVAYARSLWDSIGSGK